MDRCPGSTRRTGRRPLALVVAPVIAVAAFAAGAGCSSSEKKSINETIARNSVAVAAKKAFDDHEYPLDGVPKCEARSKTTTTADVACTGKTDKGEPIALLGTTKDARQLRGTFVGTVAGREIFRVTCLGC